ncbi:translation initiation factor IF-2 [Anolis carolinensis]|uniref:translation initiation factor IF-2 n=1 Tax=Anolis carolinensis TaxID=28377 RepID=UPI002F2B7E8C
MSAVCRERRPFLGVTPVALVLVLCLHLQGSASRCIDVTLEQELEPLPPGVERCSLPSGLLKPDVSRLGHERDATDGGDSRIVGGSPATSGGFGGGGSSGGSTSPTPRPTSQGGRPFPSGKPGSIFGRNPNPFGRPREPGPYGNRPSPYGPGPEPYASGPYGNLPPGLQYNNPRIRQRPEWKAPGIPYIPSAKEWGGGHIPIRKENPNAPYAVPYGGGAGSYSSPYGDGDGSMSSGMRGRYDGSYGPIPESLQPGGGQRGIDGVNRGPPCNPNC